MRESETKNANPAKQNRVLVGGDPFTEVTSRHPPKVRKNAVLAIEHMLSASPEYFRDPGQGPGEYNEQKTLAWVERAVLFLEERYGDNLASAVLHLDESTPHIQAMVVPLRADGKLDAARLFGPDALTDLQDRYAEAMKPLGLVRGVQGSPAKHERIKRHYGLVNQPMPDIPSVATPAPSPLPPRSLLESIPFTQAARSREKVEEEAKAQKRKRLAEERARAKAMEKALPALSAKAAASDQRQKADKARDARLGELRASSALLRQIPLPSILERLGAVPDKKDKHNWLTPSGRITVTDTKFFNHDANRGGGGAIDLVMDQVGTDYRGAVAWLSAEFGSDAAIGQALASAQSAAVEAVKEKAPSLVPDPSPDPTHAQAVREYLTQKRGLSARLVDGAMKAGRIFAVSIKGFVNAAFRLDGGGVEMRGIGSLYHGVRGRKGLFVVKQKDAVKTVFVESAVEAMSYLDLHPAERVKVVSTTGSADIAAAMKERLPGLPVVAAFNNDGTGERMSQRLKDTAPDATRERPGLGCKDWNDQLQLERNPDAKAERLAQMEQQRIEEQQRQQIDTPKPRPKSRPKP
jgi:hypothetical protein